MEKKDIEIPFGAFNSELGGFEYTIPEGYKAEIKDGKVVVRKTESEDERIRKELIEFVKSRDGFKQGYIAWLEKQGEQKQHLELNAEQKSPICWIKCSDELPNRDGTYLVVTDGSHNDVYDMAKYDSIDGWHKASEIIYWMPIPQLNNESIIEQKPAWSEEDEAELTTIIDFLISPYTAELCSALRRYAIDWLKSLKDRVQPQPQKEWSEEDETMLERVIDFIPQCMTAHGYNEYINWFKSLKERIQPQNTWKPTEEQIRVVNRLRHCFLSDVSGNDIVILDALLEQLKKL